MSKFKKFFNLNVVSLAIFLILIFFFSSSSYALFESRVLRTIVGAKDTYTRVSLSLKKYLGYKKQELVKIHRIYPSQEELSSLEKIYEPAIKKRFALYYLPDVHEPLSLGDDKAPVRDIKYIHKKGTLFVFDVYPGFFVIDKDVKNEDVIGTVVPAVGCVIFLFRGEKDDKIVMGFSHTPVLDAGRLEFMLNRLEELQLENTYIVFDILPKGPVAEEVYGLIYNEERVKKYRALFDALENDRFWLSESGLGERSTNIIQTKDGIVISRNLKYPYPLLYGDINKETSQYRQRKAVINIRERLKEYMARSLSRIGI